MVDADDVEKSAMNYAGEQAGKYLESITKLSWKAMTIDEWDTFINVVCTNYEQRKTELVIQADPELAFIRRDGPELPPEPGAEPGVLPPDNEIVKRLAKRIRHDETRPGGASARDKDYFRRGQHLRARSPRQRREGGASQDGQGEETLPVDPF